PLYADKISGCNSLSGARICVTSPSSPSCLPCPSPSPPPPRLQPPAPPPPPPPPPPNPPPAHSPPTPSLPPPPQPPNPPTPLPTCDGCHHRRILRSPRRPLRRRHARRHDDRRPRRPPHPRLRRHRPGIQFRIGWQNIEGPPGRHHPQPQADADGRRGQKQRP